MSILPCGKDVNPGDHATPGRFAAGVRTPEDWIAESLAARGLLNSGTFIVEVESAAQRAFVAALNPICRLSPARAEFG
jgi:hypothetical protein